MRISEMIRQAAKSSWKKKTVKMTHFTDGPRDVPAYVFDDALMVYKVGRDWYVGVKAKDQKTNSISMVDNARKGKELAGKIKEQFPEIASAPTFQKLMDLAHKHYNALYQLTKQY